MRGSLGMFFRKFPGRDFPGGPCTSTAGDMGLIPGQGTKIPQAKKKKRNRGTGVLKGHRAYLKELPMATA